MAKRSVKYIRERIDRLICGELEGSVNDVIAMLRRYQGLDGEDIRLESSVDYDGEVYFDIYRLRPETDTERKQRLAQERKRRKADAERKERRELAEYERLRKKFEGAQK